MKKWYVVQVKHKQEEVAEENLDNQGFITYNPTMMEQRVHRGEVVAVQVPLFRGYMFVRFDISKDAWRSVCSTKGVYRLLTATEDNCMPLPDGFVEELRTHEDASGFIEVPGAVKVLRDFVIGDELEVSGGVFKGFTGIVQRIQKDRVVILLSLLNGKTAVELTKAHLSLSTSPEVTVR